MSATNTQNTILVENATFLLGGAALPQPESATSLQVRRGRRMADIPANPFFEGPHRSNARSAWLARNDFQAASRNFHRNAKDKKAKKQEGFKTNSIRTKEEAKELLPEELIRDLPDFYLQKAVHKMQRARSEGDQNVIKKHGFDKLKEILESRRAVHAAQKALKDSKIKMTKTSKGGAATPEVAGGVQQKQSLGKTNLKATTTKPPSDEKLFKAIDTILQDGRDGTKTTDVEAMEEDDVLSN